MPPRAKNSEVESEEKVFKAADLLKLAGLTYRQLSDWENRAGVLDTQRTTDGGWRKFSGEEVLALAVCAELRRTFALPLEKVGGLRSWLLKAPPNSTEALVARRAKDYLQLEIVQEEALQMYSLTTEQLKAKMADESFRHTVSEYIQAKLDSLRDCPIRYAVKAAEKGATVYLCTDFDRTLLLLEDNLAKAIVARLWTTPVLILPLNGVFDQVREVNGDSVLPRDTLRKPLLDRWKEMQERIETTEDEREILTLIRDKAYQRVVIQMDDGQILRAEVHEDLSQNGEVNGHAEIMKAIKEKDFSTVSVQKANGKVVRFTRKSTIKFGKVAGKT